MVGGCPLVLARPSLRGGPSVRPRPVLGCARGLSIALSDVVGYGKRSIGLMSAGTPLTSQFVPWLPRHQDNTRFVFDLGRFVL